MISGTTKLYGIFGYPVEHTFSPGMHNAAFKKLRMNARYVPFAVHPDNLRVAAKAILPLGICGLNITVPHKQAIISCLDELSEEARLIGAVNTIQIVDGKLVGHNTDGRGFIRSLRDSAGYDLKGKTVFLIGSGGAARAVGFSLALSGVHKIFLYDVDLKKAVTLARTIREKTGVDAQTLSAGDVASAANESGCLINATPLGLKKNDPLPLKKEFIHKRHLVYDLVYNPLETKFLKAAKERGAKRLSGLGMLLYQGVIAFEIWTGVKAPVDIMKNALTRQIVDRTGCC